MKTFTSKFDIADRVWIDGEGSIEGTVTSVAFYSNRAMALVSWIHNGVAVESWFDDWRIKEVKK